MDEYLRFENAIFVQAVVMFHNPSLLLIYFYFYLSLITPTL